MTESLVLEMAGVSDVGRVRDHNEDAIRWDTGAGWAILADGMGGHLAGEVASEIAIETVARHVSSVGTVDTFALSGVLRDAIGDANTAIYQRAKQDQHCYNMGTTVVAVVLKEGWMSCAHVGDSRLYRLNRDGLIQLTHDHSLVQELVDEGMMSSEEAADSVHRNVITRALGLEAAVEVDLMQLQVVPGDLFLLCSDGLSDVMSEAEMARLLGDGPLDAMAQSLVDEANGQGGKDNISVILIRVTD